MDKQEMITLLKEDVKKFNENRESEFINLCNVDLRYAGLRDADLRYADLRYADLRNADLSGADLRYADLSYADLDFSCLPLWCGSFNIKTDMKLVYQLCYHICRLNIVNKNGSQSKTGKTIQKLLTQYANKFHRVEECGIIKEL